MHAKTILISGLMAASALAYSPFPLGGRSQALVTVAAAAVVAAPAAVYASPVVDAKGGPTKRQGGGKGKGNAKGKGTTKVEELQKAMDDIAAGLD